MSNKTIPITFVSNDNDHPRHEMALERFAALADLNRSGSLMLVEMLNIKTRDLEYVAYAYWDDPESGERRVVPFAKLFVNYDPNELYAFPDGNGGYNGDPGEEVEDDEVEATDDQESSD